MYCKTSSRAGIRDSESLLSALWHPEGKEVAAPVSPGSLTPAPGGVMHSCFHIEEGCRLCCEMHQCVCVCVCVMCTPVCVQLCVGGRGVDRGGQPLQTAATLISRF
ncbi:hypothetical protein AAY473_015085 [Plecturocebus cupreus]